MKTKPSSPRGQVWNRLVCPECGNSHRFIEVMAEEAHIVDGNRNYIGLLEGIVDRYICSQCSTTIELDELTEK